MYHLVKCRNSEHLLICVDIPGGRYRNSSMWFALSGYRHLFYKSDNTLGKHGFITWLGAGIFGENVGNFEQYIPTVGLDYRLQVQLPMNLRVDFGFRLETFGFYFNFNEAF